MKNKPYVKAHIDGKLINPITKDNPYLHQYPTTREIKKFRNLIIKGSK